MTEMTLTISPRAAKQIKKLMAEDASDRPLMLRITVNSGGCSGFQYQFKFDTERMEEDFVFHEGQATVVIDEPSLAILDGSEVDYVEELIGSAFTVKNPNAAASCGCGTSFSLK